MLPCNVIVQQLEDGVELAAVNPVASMIANKNDQLDLATSIIQAKLKSVIEGF